MRHRFVEVNGVRLHVVEAGVGPLVVLLHGFPECWYSWRRQIPVLADGGYHVIAPDMRGYNLSDKPRRGYDIGSLVADVAGLIDAFGGGEPAHLVGHDWGGIVAWQTAWRRPALVRTLTVLNAPHPTAFAEYMRRHPRQMLRSWYMGAFLLPRLPEWLLTRNHAAAIASAFRRGAKDPATFSEADLEVYREAFLRPGVATAAVNYYRMALREGVSVLPTTPVVVPTLVLWGQDDPLLSPNINDDLRGRVNNITIRRMSNCGHWTQQEQPDVVNSEMLGWFGRLGALP